MEVQKNILFVQEEPRGASELMEVAVPAQVPGVTKQRLPDQQDLRSTVNEVVVVKSIRVITADVLAISPLLGLTVAPLTELQKMSLTLYSDGWEKGQLIPVLSLVDIFTEASGVPWKNRPTRLNDWQKVDWPKSFITYSNGTAAVGAPYAVLFEIEYIKFDKNGNELKGAQ